MRKEAAIDCHLLRLSASDSGHPAPGRARRVLDNGSNRAPTEGACTKKKEEKDKGVIVRSLCALLVMFSFFQSWWMTHPYGVRRPSTGERVVNVGVHIAHGREPALDDAHLFGSARVAVDIARSVVEGVARQHDPCGGVQARVRIVQRRP